MSDNAAAARAILSPAADQQLWDELLTRPTIALQISALTSTQKIVSGAGILIGAAIIDGALGAGSFALIDGFSTNEPFLAEVSWAAGGSGLLTVASDGVLFRAGLFISRNAGTLAGAVWVKI